MWEEAGCGNTRDFLPTEPIDDLMYVLVSSMMMTMEKDWRVRAGGS